MESETVVGVLTGLLLVFFGLLVWRKHREDNEKAQRGFPVILKQKPIPVIRVLQWFELN